MPSPRHRVAGCSLSWGSCRLSDPTGTSVLMSPTRQELRCACGQNPCVLSPQRRGAGGCGEARVCIQKIQVGGVVV